MDGTNRYGIIRSKLGWPAGITLDMDAKRVYWVDSRYDYIETTTYDGLHRYAKKWLYIVVLDEKFHKNALWLSQNTQWHFMVLCFSTFET